MSLSTFDGLRQEVLDWGHREDVANRVDTFIQMAEFDMYNNPFQVLRVRGQETTNTFTVTGQTLALPTDFMEMREVRFLISQNDQKVIFRTPDQMKRKTGTGRPEFFTVTDQIEFNRVPDSNYTIELKYFAIPTPLSTDNQTNVVLSTNPNIYLFGALSALFKYAMDEQQAAINFQQFMNEIKGTNRAIKRGRYGPAPQMTLAGTIT